ncbi:MAG: DUF1761 domain-containing protein [Gammaproteobacteria bacterium]|jgi:hypothetical protein|nr:DUF1761 domain-containing protein [Gammaproteobacteria bacterium]
MIDGINLWAVLTAALSAFLLGGVWYSKVLFGNIWARENGMQINNKDKGHRAYVFIFSFILSFIAAFALALLLRRKPGFYMAFHTGILTGVCWVSTSFGINYLFANRSLKLFLIDAGYHTCQFTLYGLILGLWSH